MKRSKTCWTSGGSDAVTAAEITWAWGPWPDQGELAWPAARADRPAAAAAARAGRRRAPGRTRVPASCPAPEGSPGAGPCCRRRTADRPASPDPAGCRCRPFAPGPAGCRLRSSAPDPAECRPRPSRPAPAASTRRPSLRGPEESHRCSAQAPGPAVAPILLPGPVRSGCPDRVGRPRRRRENRRSRRRCRCHGHQRPDARGPGRGSK